MILHAVSVEHKRHIEALEELLKKLAEKRPNVDSETRRVKYLAERICSSGVFSGSEEDEAPDAWDLAHTLTQIDKSAQLIANKYVPLLLEEPIGRDSVIENLQDIGEEIRNIMLQTNGSKYYDYLVSFAAGLDSADD